MSQSFMEMALSLAKEAAEAGEVPVGAVIVDKDARVVAKARNRVIELYDATAHAEVLAIREAGLKLGSERLVDCDLYVTLEPCTMCAGAISFARLRRVYYGCTDPKGGGIEQGASFFEQETCHHRPEVYGGISEREASLMLKRFFKEKRD